MSPVELNQFSASAEAIAWGYFRAKCLSIQREKTDRRVVQLRNQRSRATKDKINKFKFPEEKYMFSSTDCTLIHTTKHHSVPSESHEFTVLKTQTAENEVQVHLDLQKPQGRAAGILSSPSSKSNGHCLLCPKLAATSWCLSFPTALLQIVLSSTLFTGVWCSIIKEVKHFEILGKGSEEDLESVQPWNRKEIPACPLQLISCQAGAWDLIVPTKFACITTNITGGGSNPTALFTLCLTYCLCWGKENCNYIYWLTCMRLPRYQHWSSHIISRVMLGQETDIKNLQLLNSKKLAQQFLVKPELATVFWWEGSKWNISPAKN